MKLSSFLALLYSSAALASDLALASRGPKCPQKDGNTDTQTIASWKAQGLCFNYLGAGNSGKAMAPCAGPDGYYRKVKGSKSGVEGAQSAIKAAVQGAKSFYENGEEAASFSGNWIGPSCGIPDFGFDLSMVFDPSRQGPGLYVARQDVSPRDKIEATRNPKHKPTVEPTGRAKPAEKSGVKSTAKPTNEPKTTGKSEVKSTVRPTHETETTQKPTSTTTATKTSSIASSSTPGAGCAYCGEFEIKAARGDKYRYMYARAADGDKSNAPYCPIPPKEDHVTKRDLSGTSVDRLIPRVFSLYKRSGLSDKEVKATLNGFERASSVGRYASRSQALDITEISKYWAFENPGSSRQCSVEVVRSDTWNIVEFETDHVFEAQTLENFFKWMADESTPDVGETYTKPKASWVSEVPLDEEANNPFKIVKPGSKSVGDLDTPRDGELTVTLMAYGFGRSDGVKT
ncbi:hypothetical protein LX36DRAFT_708408 [Colletotrichum falcatum]|nr:hypothetical protein LX36DRAFT_708408 [Colletotrichum falcatum]